MRSCVLLARVQGEPAADAQVQAYVAHIEQVLHGWLLCSR